MFRLKTVRLSGPTVNVILDEYIDALHKTGFYGSTKSETIMWMLSHEARRAIEQGKIKPIKCMQFHIDQDD